MKTTQRNLIPAATSKSAPSTTASKRVCAKKGQGQTARQENAFVRLLNFEPLHENNDIVIPPEQLPPNITAYIKYINSFRG